ncbi:HAMP domain-containing histidine kinase [Chromobacterium vaccinii]|uniref:sensor histidine kinase n=1 Tax=Chromobacterium vaccinii TaxID=1108595 RepID=UPI001E2FCFEA|nr:HAMP domain-containing sensor histidine kinase [Chromobacterium vaccinii]MCD4483591.1 HAMP domain-containing histidine kinase [Chromobacterium vaccinii]
MKLYAHAQRGRPWLIFFFMVVLLPMSCFLYVQSTLFSKDALEQAAGPGEGYYWAASQYRYAVQRLYGEANAYALGVETFDDLQIAYDVLESKYLVLNRSVSPQLRKNAGYAALLERIAGFMARTAVLFPETRHDAVAMKSLRAALDEMSPVIAELVMAAHLEEVRLRDASIEQTLRLRNFALGCLIAWAVLAVFLAREVWKAIRRQEIIELQRGVISAAQQAKEEAVQTALARSTMLSSVSHEILTPLHTIQGGVELLSDQAADPRARRTIANVRVAADYLSRLMQDLLDMGRLDAGRMTLKPTAFAPDLLVAGVVGEFQSAARAKGLLLSFSAFEEASREVCADATRVRQVVGNLISNALRYTDHGEVHVALAWEPDGVRPCLVLTVSDTGIGIPEHERGALFDAFSQGKGVNRGGAGMGLAIVRKIAALMGGEAYLASSEAGKGSVFVARLPVEAA